MSLRAGGGNCPSNSAAREIPEQFTCPGKKFQATDRFRELGFVFSFKNINADILSRRALDLSQQFTHERLPAHADAPMYFPVREHDTVTSQSFRPGRDVFVNAVDERAVQVEQHGGRAQVLALSG